MPYEGQKASLDGHADFFRNEEVSSFLSQCHYIRGLSKSESEEAVSHAVETIASGEMPSWIVASDGSRYESSLRMEATSVRVGFVKASRVFIKTEKWKELQSKGRGRSLDPFLVARLKEGVDCTAWTLPGANVRYKFARDAKTGFRHRLFDLMAQDRTFGKRSYLELAFSAFARHPAWVHRPASAPFVKVQFCPDCGEKFAGGGLTFSTSDDSLPCQSCGAPIWATDCFGLHRDFNDVGGNESVLTKTMNVLEALMLFESLYDIETGDLHPSVAFVNDGPLAVFGSASWLSGSLLSVFHAARETCARRGDKDFLVVGLQKEGMLMEHARMLGSDLMPGRCIPIGLEYRSKFVRQEPPKMSYVPSLSYWGQDFIYRSRGGQMFVFSLPFWLKDRTSKSFPTEAHDASKYGELGHAIEMIEETMCAMYPSSVVPIILAHEAASISPIMGGAILDSVSAGGLSGRGG